jgi:transcriptional regulator with XRE-family HTH domain
MVGAMTQRMTAQVEKVPGWWVREARLAAKKSQRALEELTGRDRTTVYRWERDDAEVEWMTWCGILHLLGHPIGWEPASRTPRIGGDEGETEPPKTADEH